jgi:hypothetical protein
MRHVAMKYKFYSQDRSHPEKFGGLLQQTREELPHMTDHLAQ